MQYRVAVFLYSPTYGVTSFTIYGAAGGCNTREKEQSRLQVLRGVVVVQQNDVFCRAMISFDLALRHRVIGPTARVPDPVLGQVLLKLTRDITRPIVR